MQFSKFAPRFLAALFALTWLAACADTSLVWYEERCVRAGLTKDSPAYEQCVARELNYLKENRRINQTLRDENR